MTETSDPGGVPPAGDEREAPAPGRPLRRTLLYGAGAVVVVAASAAIVAGLIGIGDDGGGGPRSRTRTSSERLIEQARSEDDPDDIEVPEPERPGDLGNDPLLDRLAEECFDADPSSCDELFRESSLGSDYEKYGSTCGERTKGGQSGGCSALYPDPDYAGLRRQCAGGDDRACDTLYEFAPRESVDEHFGSTCGGRSDDQLVGACAAGASAGDEADSP